MKLYKMHGVLFQVQLLRSLTFFHLESLKDNLILLLFVLYAPFSSQSPESLVTEYVLLGVPELTYGLFFSIFFFEHYAFFSFKQKAIP